MIYCIYSLAIILYIVHGDSIIVTFNWKSSHRVCTATSNVFIDIATGFSFPSLLCFMDLLIEMFHIYKLVNVGRS